MHRVIPKGLRAGGRERARALRCGRRCRGLVSDWSVVTSGSSTTGAEVCGWAVDVESPQAALVQNLTSSRVVMRLC